MLRYHFLARTIFTDLERVTPIPTASHIHVMRLTAYMYNNRFGFHAVPSFHYRRGLNPPRIGLKDQMTEPS